jgi:hypothetical protein
LRDPARCYTAVSNIFLPNLTHTRRHLKREPRVVKKAAQEPTTHTLLKNVAPFRRKIWPHRSGQHKTTTRFGMSEKELLLLLCFLYFCFSFCFSPDGIQIALLTLYNPIVEGHCR